MTTKEKKEIEKILRELRKNLINSFFLGSTAAEESKVLKQIQALNTILNTLN